MTDETTSPDAPTFEGMPDDDKTSIGFGGQTIGRRLVIGDEIYLLLKCEVVSDGREKKKGDNGEFKYKAGVSTTLLAELSSRDAVQVAQQYG